MKRKWSSSSKKKSVKSGSESVNSTTITQALQGKFCQKKNIRYLVLRSTQNTWKDSRVGLKINFLDVMQNTAAAGEAELYREVVCHQGRGNHSEGGRMDWDRHGAILKDDPFLSPRATRGCIRRPFLSGTMTVIQPEQCWNGLRQRMPIS